MNILILQPWIRVGGAELVSVYLARSLMEQGHDPHIAAVFVDMEDMPGEAAEVSYILPASRLSNLCSRNRVAFLLLGPLALFLISLKASAVADVLNPHNFPSHWIAAVVGWIRRIPVVWTCNEPPEDISARDIRSIGLADYLGWLLASSPLDRIFVRGITAIHVLSERVREEVNERYGRESRIISAGVNFNTFLSGSAENAKSKYELDGHFVLLAVGKLHPQKNHIACIEALSMVRPYLPDPVFLIAGDGPMRQELERAATQLNIADAVKFLGRVSMSDLADLYAVCDINLFPALNQSWGLTPFEALVAGSISIVSSDSGAAEVFERIPVGVVAEPDAASLAEAILRIYKSPEEYSDSVLKGRDYVQANLTNAVYAERLGRFAYEIVQIRSRSKSDIRSVSEGMR
ncbi:MAG: glycosyltransferase family 4 protein [Anaerolineales bacterium]